MSWDVDRNMTEIYNHNNSNSNNNFKGLKFINLFIRNRLNHFKQFTKIIIIKQSVFNNDKSGDILNTSFGWKIEYNSRKKLKEVKRK